MLISAFYYINVNYCPKENMSHTMASFAHFYHEQTKYHPGTIHSKSNQIDWDSQPVPFKEYPKNLEHIDLSPYIPLSTNPFADTPLIPSNQWTEQDRPLGELSRLLYLTNGVTAIVPYPPNPLLMRAAPSAGGLYPNEVYVLTNNYCKDIDNGLYNYQVKTHSLCKILGSNSIHKELSKACFDHPAFEQSDLTLIVTALFHRSSWRYKDRAYRRILLDSGHILGNISLASYALKRKGYLIGGFVDKEVNDLMMLEDNEHVLFALTLPKLDKNLSISSVENPSALPSDKKLSRPPVPNGQFIEALHEFSNINSKLDKAKTSVISTTLKDYLRQPQDTKLETFLKGEVLSSEPIEWTKCSLMTSILRRRSTRHYDREVALTKKQLTQILQFAYCPNDFNDEFIDSNPNLFAPELIKSYLIINNVEGLEPGCYSFVSEQKTLKQIRFKELTEEAHRICLSQDLGRDCSVLLIHTVNLDKAVDIYGERAYRYLHTDAGNIGQRANLAAMKLGLGASGIGGFFDDMVNEVLGISTNDAILYITTLGVPQADIID